MSVVIRKVGGAAQWTCTLLTDKGGKRKEKCGHMAVADTEQSARVAYEAHKREEHR